ncbi:hypothetical protein H2200_011390 [Cladophialophora chaetospira]|uniref:F-box domain-containing protein n=1 Tax=Cladophialophora chaetospira TaxID=386627 RepID=A0AA38WZ78_9EURO|nr:hypothetical protein H2200_011390 [Cladophialophora chaetospira]
MSYLYVAPITIPVTTTSLLAKSTLCSNKKNPTKSTSHPNQEAADKDLAEPQTFSEKLQPDPSPLKPAAMASSPPSRSFAFMDLPVELRTEVFDCFAQLPEHMESVVPEQRIVGLEEWCAKMEAHRAVLKERRAISITRSSLLFVSRQFNIEWAPIWFRSTDIIVHGPKLDYWGPTPCSSDRESRIGRELELETFFNVASHRSLSNVRRLRFDASIHHDLVPSMVATTVNWPALRRFADILQHHRGSLPLLQEVEMYARHRWNVGINKSAVWNRTHHLSPQKAWSVVSEDGKWEEIEALLVGASLKGWNTTRNLNLRWSGAGFHDADTVHIHITKPTGTEKGGATASNPSPKIVLRYMDLHEALSLHIRDFGSHIDYVDLGRYPGFNQDELDADWERQKAAKCRER